MADEGGTRRLLLEDFGVTTRTGFRSELVSAHLEEGQCLALVGRAGSGKSLIFERLCGVLRPGVTAVGKADHQKIVLVPQDARLAALPTDQVWSLLGLSGFRVRVRQATGISLPAAVYEKRSIALMEELRLDADRVAELAFRDLSSTERRSVLLVAALLQKPSILAIDGWDELMDGPTREQIAGVLHRAMVAGMTLLLSSRRFPLRKFEGAQVVSLGESTLPGDAAVPLLQRAAPHKAHKHPLLELNRVTVEKRRLSVFRRRPPAVPLDGASLFVRHGETVVLFGAAGSGKTTLLEAISRLSPATRGTIRVEGHDVTHAKGRRAGRLRKDVQLVFQDAASVLDGHRTVQAHLEEAMALRKGTSGSPGEWLERLGLSPRLLRSPADELSAAESQRVDLARSLVVAPKLVLFDAPEVSAASTDGGVLAALLRAEKAQGRTFLVATSDPELARTFADRVAVLASGRVIEFGTREQVLDRPGHPMTRALISGGAIPLHDPTAPASGCPYVSVCNRRKLPECDEHEPMLAPLVSERDLTSDTEAGQRRAACFFPITD